MGSPFIQNLRIMAAKLETTAGTAETITSAEFDGRARGIEITANIDPDDDSSKFATGDHGEDAALMGAQSATIKFKMKCAWGGSVTAEPKWFKFANACGAVKKAYTTTGIALQPQKSYDNKTITIAVMDIQQGATPAAIKYTFAGCIGQMVVGAEGIGKPWIIDFSFQGKLVSVEDVTNANILALTSPDTTLADVLLNNAMTIGAVAQRISKFSLNTGNAINPLIKQSDATGYEYFGITDRKPRFTCDPITQPIATEDIFSTVKNSTAKVISLASPHFTLKIPVAQLLVPAIENREGYLNYGQNWRCLRNGSTDTDIAAESTWELLIGARA